MALAAPSLVAAIAELAERAGERILELYASGCAVERKADSSPVTEADRAAERIILPALAALTPDIPIVAEEAVAAGIRPKVGQRFWLVDSLDGTKEFIARAGEFTVNIALIEAGLPTLGVVHIPVTSETFAAHGQGKATRRLKGGSERAIGARKPPEDGLVVLTSRAHADEPRLDAYIRAEIAARGTSVKLRRPAGSSLKFCLIAAGEADLYPRLGTTMEWDTAAGHAVLAAAGGRVETLDGAPLRYGKPDFRNPDFVARGK